MQRQNRANVLIVGGGPAGLALAAELGWRGVSSILIEQGDGVIATPKMNEVNARSMEHCRRWGIADQVLNCPFPADHPMDAAFVTSLFGYELGRVRRPPRNAQAPQSTSPYNLQACSQHWFDPMLQRLARSFSCVDLRNFTRLDNFEQSPDRATASVTDVKTGQAGIIEADYMVGCDGVNSAVRRGLGIELVGKGTIGHPVHTFFLAPRLLQECGKTLATFFMLVDNGGMWGNLRIIDPAIGLWRLMIDETNGRQTEHTFDREGVLRRALGRPYTVEWLNVSNWHRRSLVATSYGKGRVFLSGDCVHQLSPTGALGMNTGIGDSVDIGWKLAAVLEGWGGDRLLQSYDAERRLVGQRNVGMATQFYEINEEASHFDGELEAGTATGHELRERVGRALVERQGREFMTIGCQLGYRYDPSPIVIPDGAPAPPDTPHAYVPSARPGGRAPHIWLHDGTTILDHFGRGFVLLRFAGEKGGGALIEAARTQGVPLRGVDIDRPDAATLYERRFVLVRPDGHVAWRADTTPLPAQAEHIIDTVRGAA
jgi:2-polyprenyl-6-methoxyphenol hydroxylase-like FAD-dependent oxidoreductase